MRRRIQCNVTGSFLYWLFGFIRGGKWRVGWGGGGGVNSCIENRVVIYLWLVGSSWIGPELSTWLFQRPIKQRAVIYTGGGGWGVHDNHPCPSHTRTPSSSVILIATQLFVILSLICRRRPCEPSCAAGGAREKCRRPSRLRPRPWRRLPLDSNAVFGRKNRSDRNGFKVKVVAGWISNQMRPGSMLYLALLPFYWKKKTGRNETRGKDATVNPQLSNANFTQ